VTALRAFHGSNENLQALVGPQAETGTAEAQQTRTTGLQHLHAAAGTEAQLGHSGNPAKLTTYVYHFGHVARAEQFQRQEDVETGG
jgi:hypothetical protein